MFPVAASAAASQLGCAPATLAFGATVVGQIETLPVTVTNKGQASTTISGVTASNSEFTVSSVSLPLVLLPGQSVELSVSFTPARTGWTGGVIKFITGAAYSNLPLPVAGSGVNSVAVTASPSVVSFGRAALGTISTVPVVLTNMRPWKLTLSSLQTTGPGFSVSGTTFPLTLEQGQSVTLNVAFSPESAGTVAGSLFISGAGVAIPLNAIGVATGQLTANPASLTFASVPAGTSATLTDSFTNTGGTSVTISQATVTGTGFSVSGLSFPLVLFPGASVTFSAKFAPGAAATATGGITVVSNASNPTLNIPLAGSSTAQGQLTLAPTALNFGQATVGTNVSQTSSLSAGGASVTVSSASLSSAEFSLTGISFPVTIPAGQSVPVTLTFGPQTSGAASAVLSVTSNATNTTAQTLSGVGVAATPHSVSLSWTDSDSGVVGYNVYRGSVSGGPYAQINSALESTPAYSDDSVAAGQTYYYVTTAVDGSGAESGYSNEAEGVIPTP
jgi:archaellum component FlaF (FlaF/FlaG flagellin family)